MGVIPPQDAHRVAPVAPARAWYAVGLLTVCYILSYIDRQILSLLVTPIKTSLGLSDSQIGALQGVAFSIFFVAATIPLARLADRGSRPKLIASVMAVWSVMTMACGLASSFWHLMLARIGVAMGEAGLPPAGLTLMADLLDRRSLARATSLFLLAPFIGGGLALMLGGAFYEASAHWTMPVLPGIGRVERWQLVFFLVGLPGLLLAPLVVATLREPDAARHEAPPIPFRALIDYIASDRRFVGSYMLALALIVMLLNAHIAWMPTAIIRTYGLNEARVGLLFGPVYLIGGAGGTLFAGWLVGRAAAAAMLANTLKLLRIGAVLLIAPAVLAPLATSLPLTLGLLGLAVFFTSAVVSMGSIPFQLAAPHPLRAQVIATSGLVASLLGTGLGPLVIGLLSDALAGSTRPLSFALAILAAIVVPAIALLLSFTMRAARAR